VDQQTKATLKQDHFLTTTTTGLAWASENRRSVIVTTALLLLAILVVVGGAAIYHSRSESASTAFGAAMQAYQTPLASPGQQVPPGTKTYSSVNERARAANALFSQVAGQYGMTPAGKTAAYFSGLTDLEAGQNQQAEDALKKVASGWDKDLAALAKLSLADLYRQTGRDSQAVALYQDLAAKPVSTVPAGVAQLQLAELYQSENKPEEARKIYAQLKDKDAKGPAGIIAAQKLNPAAAAQLQQ
jgi:tetratricopeptide (TPR) repeat protein